MSDTLKRSCDIDTLAIILFLEFSNRYKNYPELTDDKLRKIWESAHKDHSLVSEAGYGVVLKQAKQLRKEDKNFLDFVHGSIDHRCTADFFSEDAQAILSTNDWRKGKLRYEHIVPKKNILNRLKEKAKNGNLTLKYVREQLEKYYYVATITVEEDKRLSGKLRNEMPNNWDEENIFARYEEAGIELIPNPIYKDNKNLPKPN